MKTKNERGEVVVEASIVVTLVMIIITIMLYVGMILYQQTLVSVVANQTAANIAQVYSNNIKDPFTGYIEPEKVYQSVTYSNMKTDAYMDVIEQKANVFAQYRLKSSRILKNGNTSVEVEIVKKTNELLKSQVVVTVHDTYDVPLVGFFGTKSLVEFSATGRADCVDILEYINGVPAIGDPENSNVYFLPNSKNCTITFVPNRENPDSFSTVIVLKGKSIISSNRYTHSVMPSNPTDGVFEFDGWADETGTPFTASTVIESDIVVYGTWQCNVTLDADGGTVNSAATYSFNVRKGSRISIPNAYRANYSFCGWYTERNGKGVRYISNDSIITDSITLYAYWSCSHPSRYEASRSGTTCEGGTIYYKCTQCGADLGTGSYPGNMHNYIYRCDKQHKVYWFSGYGNGGCGKFHYSDSEYLEKNTYKLPTMKHADGPYRYCQVCQYCGKTRGKSYCWCGYCATRRPKRTPTNGHDYS